MRVPRRPARHVTLALVVGAAHVSSLGAQTVPGAAVAGISIGSRVRITTGSDAAFVGTLLRGMGDTLVVELPSGASLTVPQQRITRLDVSGGIQRRTWQGAGIGFLAGAGIGAVVGLATYRRSDCGDSAIGQAIVCPLIDGVSREVTVSGDALLAGSAAAIVGALIGHRGHETWVPVPLARVGDARARMNVRRVAGGVGIGAAFDF